MATRLLPEPPAVTSPAPSYRSNIFDNDQVPSWAREVAASLQTRQRPSRASSVISTRTKVSTSTALEDARSIDLNIDGLHFRINRDGSRITTTDFQGTLPPYSPYPELEVSDESSARDRPAHDEGDDRSVTTETPDQRLEPGDVPESARLHGSPDHTETGSPSRSQRDNLTINTDNTLSRYPSFTPGKETISVVKKRTVSQNDVQSLQKIPRKPVESAARLRRRNGVRLPTLVTNVADDQHPRTSGSHGSALGPSPSPSGMYPHSADPTLGNDNHSFIQRPRSPMFIGRNAPALFPSPQMMRPLPLAPPAVADDQATIVGHSPATIEEGYADTHPPPAMESENDISVHYTRLIRTIDRDHRKALHERDKEMAKLRERLNEQDTVYRQQLRARDFIIEDLKGRMAHLEAVAEAKVERARNSVEDLWESRWKDRDFHLMERMRRMEGELQVAVERAVRERDEAWAKGWKTKYGQLIVRLEDAELTGQRDLDQFDGKVPDL